MRWTGVIVGLYILFHLADLTWGTANPDFVRGDTYNNLVASFERVPVSGAVTFVIEGGDAIVWIEGKRHDWLAPHTTWDSARDQLARNLEAAWLYASARDKDFCLLICLEDELRYHEQLLVDGYRSAKLVWRVAAPRSRPSEECSRQRIGLVRWVDVANHWPELRALPELSDL